MLSVVIKDGGEPSVVALTYQNLWKELKDITGAELLVSTDWFATLPKIKNLYVCFVEADCLVNSGYFTSQLGLYQKDRRLRKLAMLSTATGVNNWANRFFGYSIEKHWKGVDSAAIKLPFIEPNRQMKSRGVYPIQIGYVPGSIIRVRTLRELLKTVRPSSDLRRLSTDISLGFWRMGDGNRVHINPNSTYVSTEEYINDLGTFDPKADDLMEMFRRESI